LSRNGGHYHGALTAEPVLAAIEGEGFGFRYGGGDYPHRG